MCRLTIGHHEEREVAEEKVGERVGKGIQREAPNCRPYGS